MHAFKRALNYFFWQRSIKGTESAIGNIILSKSPQVFARLVAYGSTVYTRANCHRNSVNTYFGELQTLPSGQTMPPNGCLCPPFWFTNDTWLEHHVTKRQLTIVWKRNGNVQSKRYSSNKLMFLNIKSFVVQVSNTSFNIQSLHLWTH